MAISSNVSFSSSATNQHAPECEQNRGRHVPPSTNTSSCRKLPADSRTVVGHSIDCAVVVVGDQHRAVLEDDKVSRAPDIIVVFKETVMNGSTDFTVPFS